MIFVPFDCYSAGTLIVLGAHRLVMSPYGRLGPIDAQLVKKDALGERISGVTSSIALEQLQKHSYDAFWANFVQLLQSTRGQLSVTTAIETACRLTVGMFGELYKQIDPVKIAEDARALRVASHYGQMLSHRGGNVKARAIEKLLQEYPAHECLIDLREAQELLHYVESADADEVALMEMLEPLIGFERYAEFISHFSTEFLVQQGDDKF